MDRIELDQKDLAALLVWRDEHKNLVRSMPAPLKAVEIVFKHNPFRIKGIREGEKLTLMLHQGTDKLQDTKFTIRPDGVLAQTGGFTKLNEESFQSILTVYCSLMALMVYGSRDATAPDEADPQKEKTSHNPAKRVPRHSSKRTTYILRTIKGQLRAMPRGAHASPSGIFTVRGHYRHYKNGKVVWIQEYKKGDGKKKKKTYKLGGEQNE